MTETNRFLIKNARVCTPSGCYNPGWLLVEGARIHSMGQGNPPAPDESVTVLDAGGKYLLPGFLDMHVHGALGNEAMDADPERLRAMARFYAKHGVTGFLPSTWSAKREAVMAALRNIRDSMGFVEGGAAILGAHVEGPYLNPKKSGAQESDLIRRASNEECTELLDTGVVRLIALAPEFDENIWLVDECVRRGITVSAGHTDATYEQMVRAVEHGLSQTTHTYNAMSPLGHRQPGVVGAAFSLDAIRCELIADNIHVHPAAMRVLYRAKGIDGVILVTDAIRAAGMPDGEYLIDTRTVTIHHGEVRLEDGTLAGSILTMNRALQNFCAATGLTIEQAWPASSRNAARAMRLDLRKGSLQPGMDADLVLIDADFNVYRTMVEGKTVYSA